MERGEWPENWPAILEPLRDHALTLEGPLQPARHYGISFPNRDVFEVAWPHLVKLKSQGAPILLKRGPSFWLKDDAEAGVCVHVPPKGQEPRPFDDEGGLWGSIYLELVVDGEIVDLNRVPLPPDTPILDQRFPVEDPSDKGGD